MMLSVYHTLFQHYALMFLQELQFTGGKGNGANLLI